MLLDNAIPYILLRPIALLLLVFAASCFLHGLAAQFELRGATAPPQNLQTFGTAHCFRRGGGVLQVLARYLYVTKIIAFPEKTVQVCSFSSNP